jgi:hypothetical protein
MYSRVASRFDGGHVTCHKRPEPTFESDGPALILNHLLVQIGGG